MRAVTALSRHLKSVVAGEGGVLHPPGQKSVVSVVGCASMRRCAKQGRSSCSNDFQITIQIRIRNDCAAFQCQLRFSGAWLLVARCTQRGRVQCAACSVCGVYVCVVWCGVACLSLSECSVLLSCKWNLNINWLLIGATASYLFVVLICLMMQQFSARQLAKFAKLPA